MKPDDNDGVNWDAIEERHCQEGAFAGFGGRDAPCGSSQKSQPQSSFEAADGVAQRRLRNAELRRRPCEAAIPRDGEESEDVIQIFPQHL